MLYKEWLSNWLENYVKPSAKQRTYTRYKEIVEQHIILALGELELSEIAPYVLQCYVTELLKCGNLRTGKGLSANSVNAIIKCGFLISYCMRRFFLTPFNFGVFYGY